MKVVLEHIAAKQADFANHPFFAELRLDRPIEQIASFAPRLAFWVMTFQDILRLNEQMVQTPALKRIARHHRDEDMGHERWFLEDIAKLTGGPLTISSLYGRATASTRDAAYQLISEVYRATDDRLRIVLVLVLESTGHVFFGRTAVLTAAVDDSPQKLKYFSDFHLHIEQAHEVFEEQIEAQILSLPLPPAIEAEALALVDRAYAAFDSMFHGLREELAERRGGTAERKDVRPPPPRLVPATASAPGVKEAQGAGPEEASSGEPWPLAVPL
jgi:hypothetical protein